MGRSDTRLRVSARWTNAGGDSWARAQRYEPAARRAQKDDLGEGLPEHHHRHHPISVCLSVCPEHTNLLRLNMSTTNGSRP